MLAIKKIANMIAETKKKDNKILCNNLTESTAFFFPKRTKTKQS
jgi:hypothetical protein